MPELRVSCNDGVGYEYSTRDGKNVSVPERELLDFIHAVTELLGPSITGVLTEIWLNEVACMECAPGPGGLDWRMVSMAASTTLAGRLIASQFPSDFDSKNFTPGKGAVNLNYDEDAANRKGEQHVPEQSHTTTQQSGDRKIKSSV